MTDTDDDIRELYQDLILDHGKHPRHFGKLAQANRESHGHNPLCGDKLTLYLTLDAEGVIQDAAFEGEGCAISIASASMMTDILKGKTAAEIDTLVGYFHRLCTDEKDGRKESPLSGPSAVFLDEESAERLKALAGVRHYPARVKCAMLPWRTLQAALNPSGGKTARTE